MLTGQAAFQGEDVTEILASVVKGEANLDLLPADTHYRVREAITRCLQKDLKRRYPDISDARYEIEQALADPGVESAQWAAKAEPQGRLRQMLPWVAAALVLGAIVAGAAAWKLRPPEPRQVMRFYHGLPADHQSSAAGVRISISPDGRQFAYSTSKGIYLRSVNDFDAKLISGTEMDPSSPFFSPDSKWIGYFSGRDARLKKIAISGGAPVSLCGGGSIVGANWSEDGSIVYADYGKGIMRVSANGGTPELIAKEDAVFHPQLLPDGKSLLYTFGSIPYKIAVKSLQSGERKELFVGDNARYIPTGHIVYAVGNNLLAVPFDLKTISPAGEPVSVVEGVLRAGAPQYAVSDSGTLVYMPGTENAPGLARRTLVWVDRKGKEEPLQAPINGYFNPRISPDGNRVDLGIASPEKRDIWIWNLAQKTLAPLTFEGGDLASPLWTADGKRIAYCSAESGVYWKASDGSGRVDLIGSGPGIASFPSCWANNGKTLVLMEWRSGYDITVMPMEGDRKFKPLLNKSYHEAYPQISADGRWMAYTSNESGQNQVYVRPFPEVEGGRWQISMSGGDSPLWSPDGRELFYRSGDAVMAAAVKTGPAFSYETSRVLLHGNYVSSVFMASYFDFATWDISPDGMRFLMLKNASSPSESEGPLRINIVLNWFEELKQRVPVK